MKNLIDGLYLEGSTKPIIIDDQNICYLIIKGGADVFLTTRVNEGLTGAKQHLVHTDYDQLIMGMNISGQQNEVICLVPLPGTTLLKFDREQLFKLREKYPLEVNDLLFTWFSAFSSSQILTVNTSQATDISLNEVITVSAGEFVKNYTQEPIYLDLIKGKCNILGALTLKPQEFNILKPGDWFKVIEVSNLRLISLKEKIKTLGNASQVDKIHEYLTNSILLDSQKRLTIENIRLQKQQENQTSQLGVGLKLLVQIFNKSKRPSYEKNEPSIVKACRIISDKEGINFETPSANPDGTPLTFREIEHQSLFRSREVILKGKWWEQDHGSMMAYEENGEAVALIQESPKSYIAYQNDINEFVTVDKEFVKRLKPLAYFFYRPMDDKPMNLRSLMAFGLRNSKRDMWVTLVISLLAALLGMATPIAMSVLIDNVIPDANHNQLYFIGCGLVAIAVANATFAITRGISMQRFQGKNGMAIQTAVWDRLLALPVPFFQKYSSGELASRANGITTIMSILSGTTSTALISGVFSIFYFFLLFYYSSTLAWIAVLLALVTIILTVGVNIIKLGYIREEVKLSNKLSGLVLQLLEGVSKLRNTGAEARGFYQWSLIFSKQRPQVYKAENVTNYLETYNAILPLFSSILIFWAVVDGSESGSSISTGQFIAFNVAYGSFLAGMLGLTQAAMSIMAIVPIYENSKPVLEAIPERSREKHQAPTLSGKIEVNNVRFRYDEDGPEVLKGINLNIGKGEYVALVGGSGSGKSTLLRILLGFEAPESGNIFYDDIEMSTLDIASLRRQLGVVLQNGSLMMGDIFKNIVGSAPLTVDDAWKAAEMCGLKEDIEAMPMKMNTMISSGVLSGGQMQRLMIARAIVHKPNILFFDEATSALDNRTQAIVTQGLESLSVTRIVIAHRLSTIINANRILYLHEGEIIEDGTYDELIAKDGFFAEMAKRQAL